MMIVLVTCPNPACGRSVNISTDYLGRSVRCPHCRQRVVFEEPREPAEQSAKGTVTSDENATVAGNQGQKQPAGAPANENLTPASTPTPAEVPRQIGRFEIRAKLGSGAFGSVYRAYDPQLEREVALKIPHAGVLDTPEHIQRFVREAKVAAKLRHGNIVPILEAAFDGTYPYIVSPFVEGRTGACAGMLACRGGRPKSLVTTSCLHIIYRDHRHASQLGMPTRVLVAGRWQTLISVAL